MAGGEVRIHVDIDPWAFACRVYLNGVDISRWCKGADTFRGTITTEVGEDEREIEVGGRLEVRGVMEAREAYRAYEETRRRERARATLP